MWSLPMEAPDDAVAVNLAAAISPPQCSVSYVDDGRWLCVRVFENGDRPFFRMELKA